MGEALLDLVDWTLADALDALGPIELEREDRPALFRHREAEQHGALLRLSSAGWLAAGRKLNMKFSRIQGGSMDIATVMIYPTASPELLPIFAAEWVVIGQHCHALILDVEIAGEQPPLAAGLAEVFGPLGQRWREQFPTNPEAPAWFHEIAQEWALFSKCSIAELPTLRLAYIEYLRAAVEHFYLPRLAHAAAGEDHPDVTAYKAHHCEHSPGRRVLEPRFGPGYTETFLRDYHFGPPHAGVPACRGSDQWSL